MDRYCDDDDHKNDCEEKLVKWNSFGCCFGMPVVFPQFKKETKNSESSFDVAEDWRRAFLASLKFGYLVVKWKIH